MVENFRSQDHSFTGKKVLKLVFFQRFLV